MSLNLYNMSEKNKQIKYLLKKIPHQPGVYKMKNKEENIIYIGKAKDLYKRVNSYFKNIDKHHIYTQKLIENITDIEYIIVTSELESLILETNLIKEYRPKYNILMKDDKNFAYIKITINEDYPRILTVRKVLKDKAKYFGPKTASSQIYATLKILRKIFPFRTCSLDIKDLGINPDYNAQTVQNSIQNIKVTHANITYPCLDFHIHRCLAPCIGKLSKEEYFKLIQQIISFLEGKYQNVITTLTANMQSAAKNRQFEHAAKIRDKIVFIQNTFEKQNIATPDHQNSDVINFYLDEAKAYFNIFQVREGKIIDQQNIILKIENSIEPNNKNPIPTSIQILNSFLQQFYNENTDIPSNIILPEKINNQKIITQWLSDLKGKKVKLLTPQRGGKDKLLKLSLENARSFANQSRTHWEAKLMPNRTQGLENLAQALHLNKIPKRLECYDISHLSGTYTVASMVVFENGLPKKDHYRHFKISLENPGKPNDFLSMQEVILRRLKYIKPQTQYIDYKIIHSSLQKRKSSQSSDKPTSFKKYKILFQKKQLMELVIISNNKLKTFFQPLKLREEHFKAVFKKIIYKFNSRRLYFICPSNQQKRYEQLNCQRVRKLSEKISLKSNQIIMVFDKSKYFEDQSFKQIPDLIVIDGGKGQLSSAIKAMQNYKLEIPIISLAKKQEEIFIPKNSNPLTFPENEPARLLLQHLRDEAHRFAIEYNRKLRHNNYTSSQLEDITGIGKIITQKLLHKFGSVEKLKKASENQIATITGRKIAIKIKEQLL